MKRDYLKYFRFTTSVAALLTSQKQTMSIICTCQKASGPMCNGAEGCPFNSTYIKSDSDSGWKQSPMTNNTQLPAEVVEKIEADATAYANEWFGDVDTIDPGIELSRWDYAATGWVRAATEYATKLHQAEQETAELKRWKMNTIETQLVPIGAYCHEYLEIGLDDNHSLLVIAELERLKQENKEWKEECERLAKVAEYWQQEYYKLNPPRQPLKIDNNPIA